MPPLARCLVLFPLLALGAAAAQGGAVTIYRCTDADGRLTLRDTPCRPGERQQTRAMTRPQDPPPRSAAAPAADPAATGRAATLTRAVVIRPPRPLYECVTPDGEVYTSDTGQGDPRWVPLWTLGYPVVIGGSRLGHRIGAPRPKPPEDGPGVPAVAPVVWAYGAGTWVRDECHPLPQREVCDRLRDRDSELRRQYNSALQSERHRITAERRGIDARLAADCGAG